MCVDLREVAVEGMLVEHLEVFIQRDREVPGESQPREAEWVDLRVSSFGEIMQ